MKHIVAMSALALVLAGCLEGRGPREDGDRSPTLLSRPGSPPPARVSTSETRPLLLTGTVAYTGGATGEALVIAVAEPGVGGAPLAVQRLPAGPLPMTFTLTDVDLVRTGEAPPAVPASVVVTARLDADGDVATTDPSEPMARLQIPARSPGLAMTLAVPR